MHTYLMEMLECPSCHHELEWTISERNEDRVVTAKARCKACDAIYPVRNEIGLFLTPELQRNDLWEQTESELVRYLREHPELEGQLMEVPFESLSPADQFYRALVLEERENFTEAKNVEELANKGIYSSEYLECWDSQLDYVIDLVSRTEGPVVDLASGRCYLVERLIRKLKRPVVVSDFSPSVLSKDRERLKSFGLDDYVSFLAFDARSTPFKNGTVPNLTTNVGLSNIQDPGSLLKELRRIVNGTFFAISHFYPEDDEANAKVIHEAKLDPLLYRRTAMKLYEEAGWNVEMQNTCMGVAHPTPTGVVLEGAGIDGLPVADTNLEWCVLLAISK